jgi:cobalamin-dependent methionine synthase I
VVVYLVTVGPGWDEAAGEYARSGRPYLALLANALGAGAADTVAKDLGEYLDGEILGGDPERKLRRLSPGYGDWPLCDQRLLVSLLNPEKTLGVTLNEGDILIPEKSTSGLMAEKRKSLSGTQER